MEENKKAKSFEETEFDILWEGKPAGLWQRFLTLIHLNFTTYQITKDELIVITGFFKKRMNTCELYLVVEKRIVKYIGYQTTETKDQEKIEKLL